MPGRQLSLPLFNLLQIKCTRPCTTKLLYAAASMGDSKCDPEFSVSCSSYAEACRCQLIKQGTDESVALQRGAQRALTAKFTAKTPRFKVSLMPIADGKNAKHYIDAVFSPRKKLYAALGAELTERNMVRSAPISADVTQAICEYVQKQAKGYRAEYASEFEGLVVDKLDSNFESMKASLGLCQEPDVE